MTAMQLGGTFGRRGIKTLIVDMDEQSTSSLWASKAKSDAPFPAKIISLASIQEKMIGEIAKIEGEFDVILIDCPPAINSTIPWSSLLISDLALIPIIPAMDNVWASDAAKKLASNAKQKNPVLQTFFVASMIRRGNLFNACMKMLRKDEDVKMLKSVLSQRNSYQESQLFGSTVHALAKSSPAIDEIESLASEVWSKLHGK